LNVPPTPASNFILGSATQVGAPAAPERAYSRDDATPGWEALVHGGGFVTTRTRSVYCRAHSLPDYVGPAMRILLVGLNPSPYAADVGVGFARPGNRFWPAIGWMKIAGASMVRAAA